MLRTLPPLAFILGLLGLIPFIIFAVLSVGADLNNSLFALRGLVAYGGTILAFLGGIHWGFTLSGADRDEPVRTRLILGIVPSLLGWVSILVSLAVQPALALALLIVGFGGLVTAEHRAQEKFDIMPSGYMAMRWIISIAVVALLTTVLVLRLSGARVLI